ncbi:MAG: hypothetical protein HFJ60_02375 [Clostridia bacterium]|jgi:hypothetical protein|nr:hypothetical protein [Clostridia bacterium]
MSIESDLRKDGIEVIKKLDTLKVNSIARRVSMDICATFPNFNLNQNDLFIKLSRLNMYFAKMPEGMAEANYFYKNSSIYFNDHIAEEDLEEFAIHECIHYIQEVKDKKNYLLRMGLCDYTEFKIYGLGLNEAAVQLMSSKILGIPKEYVKYFNISFETTSPSYYPLECCLVNQLSYITGEDILFESTINSNDNFKEKLVKLTDYKTFMTIQDSIDKILLMEEEIIKINNKIIQIDDRNKKVDNMINKINSLKSSISSTFIKTQNLIISSYFDKAFYSINDLESLEDYRRKLYNFKNYLGSVDGYTYFNDYYVDKMMDLEDKYNLLENGVSDNSLYLINKKESKIVKIFKFIRNLFAKKQLENEKE